jgi:hypothetical protein
LLLNQKHNEILIKKHRILSILVNWYRSDMRYSCIIMMVLFFVACSTDKSSDRDAANVIQDEIRNLAYKDISLAFDFGDTIEVQQYEEYVSEVDDSAKFRLVGKMVDKFDEDDLTRYELTEIDTKNKTCIKHLTAFSPAVDTAKYFHTDTLPGEVESRAYFVEGKEYEVYRIQEVDEYMRSCNVTVISPDFGFLFGKGSIGQFKMSQYSENKIVNELIKIIKSDSLLISCSEDLLERTNSMPHQHFH